MIDARMIAVGDLLADRTGRLDTALDMADYGTRCVEKGVRAALEPVEGCLVCGGIGVVCRPHQLKRLAALEES